MPNNTVSDATNLLLSAGLPQTVSGSLSSTDDLDYYRFTTTAPSDLKLAMTGLTGDAKLSVFQSNGTTPLTPGSPGSAPGNTFGNTVSTNNAGLLSESFVFNNLAAGTYIIKVEREVGVATANYRLEALASSNATANSLIWQNSSPTPATVNWQLNGPTQSGQLLPSAATNPEFAGLQYVASGYFDTDKSQDILWKKDLGNGQFQLYVWFMNADGSFRESQGVSTGTPGTTADIGNRFVIKAVEDFDGDGTSDILFDAGAIVVLWRMQGAQRDTNFNGVLNFNPSFNILGTGDFDASGTRDILFRSGGTLVTWLMRVNNNTFEFIPPPAGQVNGPGESGVVKNPTGGLVTQLGAEWDLVSVGDLNKAGFGTNPASDDKDDLIWLNRVSGVVVTWLMNGSVFSEGGALFNSAQISGEVGSYNLVGISDFNGDKNVDILWRSKTGTNLVLWQMDRREVNVASSGFIVNNGNPVNNLGTNFQILTQSNLAGQRQLVDYDANGQTDIVFRETNSGNLVFWSLNGKTVDVPKSGLVRNIDGSVPGVSSSFQVIGGLTSQLTRKTEGESTAGTDYSTAFNVGVLNTGGLTDPAKTANYQDSVKKLGGSADYYKFKLERSSDIALKLLTAKGANTLANATFEIFNDDLQRTPVALTDAQKAGTFVLEKGSYFIKVQAGSSAAQGANITYNLNIAGEPNLINFQSVSLDAVTGTLVPIQPGSIKLASVDDPVKTTPVQIQYKITNTEQKASGAVNVQFYLSRTPQINPTDAQNTFSLGTQTIARVPGNSAPLDSVYTANLPAGDDLFWTTDGNYYIGYVIDPQNAVVETVETDNTIAAKTVRIENTQTPDLKGQSLATTTNSITRGGKVTLNYSVANVGKKATGGLPNANNLLVQFFLYRPNADPNPTLRDALTIGSPEAIEIKPVNDGDDLLPVNIAGSSVTPVKSIELQLPTANNSFWGPAGTQYFIGMFTESGGLIAEPLEGSATAPTDPGNNYNLGIGIDRVSVTLA